MDRKKRIDAAMGRVKADLVFKNVNVVNVFSEEVVTTDVAVADGCVVGLGSYEGVREVDGTDKFLCPGFIDAHLHMESTLATPFELARLVTKSGTTTMIADPHEIVNVCGAAAVRYLLDATEQLPVNVYLMLPSSVPATAFETNGRPTPPQARAPSTSAPALPRQPKSCGQGWRSWCARAAPPKT